MLVRNPSEQCSWTTLYSRTRRSSMPKFCSTPSFGHRPGYERDTHLPTRLTSVLSYSLVCLNYVTIARWWCLGCQVVVKLQVELDYFDGRSLQTASSKCSYRTCLNVFCMFHLNNYKLYIFWHETYVTNFQWVYLHIPLLALSET